MALTPREQKILASIEEEISEQDPSLAATLSTAVMGSGVGRWVPVPTRHLFLLVAALTALVVLSPIAGQAGPLGIAVCTAAVIVPWLVGASREAQMRRFAREEPQQKQEKEPSDGGTDGPAGPEPAVGA